ncbi:IS110 family transposase [Flavivirga jejuensis]
MPVVNPHAAGVDIGSRSHYVCVSQDNVKEFTSFTTDLHEIAKHLTFHGIKTVALESTGFYWQQLFTLLQSYGFEIILVNARHVKNVKGHKTDVVDSKWLQLLHSIGLLSNSFQPDIFTKELRQYVRHRKSLIETSSRYISKMNKSLVLMNIQLKTVLRDLTGESGLKVIRAILEGERNSVRLAKNVGKNVKASRKDIEKALEGNWREEHLFELEQNYSLHQFTWTKIKETDNQIETLLKKKGDGGKESKIKPYVKRKARQKNDPNFDVARYAHQMTNGIDLTLIDGVGVGTLMALMSETGFDLKSDFHSAKHFSSWLGFAPNRKITGGKTISSNTPKVKNPLSKAIRDAANAAGNSKGKLGDFFRRIAYRKGRIVAVIATARKIAVIIYKMLENQKDFCYEYSKKESERFKQIQINKTIKSIKKLGISKQDLAVALN